MVLVTVGLTLIVAARHIAHAGLAAGLVVAASLIAVAVDLVMDVPARAFGGTVTTDGYAVFFEVLFALNLAVVALLSVRHVDREHVQPAEYYALLVLATTGMMLTASAVPIGSVRSQPVR